MKCPFCRAADFAVVDSRSHEDGFPVRRRRVCPACKRRVTTIEQIEEAPLKVIKKDHTREPFDLAKLRRGLELACHKRPIGDDQIESIVRQIEDYVHARYFNEVPSSELGELVMEHLHKLDQVAYVRFASVYRDFKDVSDFVDEVQPMLGKGPNGSRRRPKRERGTRMEDRE
jgi:transcriptional repressor NrdR